MIIVRISHGLGNQLFQYALGRALSVAKNLEFKLDPTPPCAYTHARYALDKFNIRQVFASPEEVLEIKKRTCAEDDPWWRKNIVRSPEYAFQKDIYNVRDDVYIQGGWQSWKYFAPVERIIRREFTVREALDGENLRLAAMMHNADSVSLHLRRGDYVNFPYESGFFFACPLSYYENAARIMAERLSSPLFFVFSDDIPWARENLKLPYPMIFVEHNADENYQDMRLMSLCRHHIIANSTFSWWGAWLGDYPAKTVITPAKWFNHELLEPKDLFPEDWIRLDLEFTPCELVYLGDLHRRAGRYTEAEGEYRKAMQADGQFADAWLAMGRLFAGISDEEVSDPLKRNIIAAMYLERSLRLQPGHKDAIREFSQLLNALGLNSENPISEKLLTYLSAGD